MSFRDTGVTAGQTYTYRVTASDAAGNTSGLSPTATVTVPSSADAYPTAVLNDGATQYWRYDEAGSPFTGDASASDNSGIQLNGPSLRQTPAAVNGPSTAMGFDGTDQAVYSDRRTIVDGDYSIETWFRTTTRRGGKLVGFGNNTTQTSSSYDKHIYLTDDGHLVFGVYPGGVRTVSTPGTYNNGAWHHVVATQDSSGIALYVDGSRKASANVTGNQAYSGYWHVGGDQLSGWPQQPTSNFFAGQIDETAIYPSALSAQQIAGHFQLASAPADTVSTVPASEDTYVNAGAPNTNYGTSGSLSVRGTSAYATYLRFTVPPAPAGTVLKSARLSVKTSTQTGAGSADSQSVVPVTGAWTESALTYSNRPAAGSGTLGTLSGATDGSTVYSVPLDTAALSSAPGSSYALALTSTGTDPLWLWSREATASEGTPQLVLTFGAP